MRIVRDWCVREARYDRPSATGPLFRGDGGPAASVFDQTPGRARPPLEPANVRTGPLELLLSIRAEGVPQPALRGPVCITERRQLRQLQGVRAVEGDLTLAAADITEADLATLSLERVTGQLLVHNVSVAHLPLGKLKRVDGEVRIAANPHLVDLSGFGIEKAGSFVVADCPQLCRLNVGLNDVNLFQLVRLRKLDSLDGLRLPPRIDGYISLCANPALVDVSSLRQVSTVRSVFVEDNTRLSNAYGLLHLRPRTHSLRGNGFSRALCDQLIAQWGVELSPPVTVARGDSVHTPAERGPRVPPAEWTFFVHLNADNDLEAFGAADLREMAAVGSVQGQVNVFALVDGHGGYHRGQGWSANTRLVYLRPPQAGETEGKVEELVVAENSELGRLLREGRGELDMASPRVLRAAIKYVQANYPSRKYMVTLWNHGNGPEHAGVDSTSGHRLKVSDLVPALDGLGIDVLGFDECLMANVAVAEVAHQLGVKYVVGSEDLEPGTGWAYDDLLTRIPRTGSISAEQLARTLVESYAASGRLNTTLSATRVEAVPAIRAATDALARACLAQGGLQNPQIARHYREALRFSRSHQMDLGDFARRLASDGPPVVRQAAMALCAALQNACEAKTGSGGAYKQAHGLSIFAPVTGVATSVRLSDAWRALLATLRAGTAVSAVSPSPVAESTSTGITLVNDPPPQDAWHTNPPSNARYALARNQSGVRILQVRNGHLGSAPWRVYPKISRDDANHVLTVQLDYYRPTDVPAEDRAVIVDFDVPLPTVAGSVQWRVEVSQRRGDLPTTLAVLPLTAKTLRASD